MEEKINIAKILKYKPEGTKFWTDMFGSVTLHYMSLLIHVRLFKLSIIIKNHGSIKKVNCTRKEFCASTLAN